MTKVYISNDNSPFPGRTVDLDQLIQQRDNALEYFEYCLEHYGETDEDTIQAEIDYNAIDSLVINSEIVEETA